MSVWCESDRPRPDTCLCCWLGPRRAPGTSCRSPRISSWRFTAGRCGRSTGARTCSRITPSSTGRGPVAWGGRELFDYYLGWIANPAVGRHYRPPADDRVAFARRWGMRVAVSDVARVVHAARAGGRDVVLGGHSLGGWIATAYAAWDFGGRAGAADLDRLVLIDGASGPPAISPTDARRTLAGIEHGSAFLAPAGARLPWIAGVLSAVGSTLAVRRARRTVLAAGMAAATRAGQAAGAGDEPRAARALGRHRHEPQDSRRGPGAPRRPGRVRRPARLSGWRLRNRGARRARHQRNRRRRRNGLVSPAPPDARRKGHRRRCRQPRADTARPERHTRRPSMCPSTRSRRRSYTARS